MYNFLKNEKTVPVCLALIFISLAIGAVLGANPWLLVFGLAVLVFGTAGYLLFLDK